jgi:hypothetical protein
MLNALLKCRPSRTNIINASRKTGTPPPILLLIVLAPFAFLPSNLPKKDSVLDGRGAC